MWIENLCVISEYFTYITVLVALSTRTVRIHAEHYKLNSYWIQVRCVRYYRSRYWRVENASLVSRVWTWTKDLWSILREKCTVNSELYYEYILYTVQCTVQFSTLRVHWPLSTLHIALHYTCMSITVYSVFVQYCTWVQYCTPLFSSTEKLSEL